MGIVTNGLIGYWHYQQGVNGTTWENIAPDTKSNYSMTLSGATLQSDGVYFDATDDYGVLPIIPNLKDHLTIETTFTLIDHPFAAHLYGEDFSKSLNISTNKLRTYINGNVDGQTTLARNTMYSVTHVFDKTNSVIKAYLNGKSEFTKAGVTTNPNFDWSTAPLYIGTSYSTSSPYYYHLGGKIHSFKIYNRALSDVEVGQNYFNGIDVGLSQPTIPPSPLSGLVTQDTYGTSIALKWNRSEEATSYIIKRNGINITTVASLTYTDVNLTPNTLYTYEVIPFNNIGNGTSQTITVKTLNTRIVEIIEDFEDTNYQFNFTQKWIRTNTVKNTGNYSLVNNDIGNSQNTIETFNFTLPSNGKLSFVYKVSTESGYDKFNVKLDGATVVNGASGEINWTSFIKDIGAGNHQLVFEYVKDGSSDSGTDSVYIDNIKIQYEELIQDSTPPVPQNIIISKPVISRITGMNLSTLKFSFNKDVTQWTVNVLGTSPTTGTVADSGSTVAANTEITAVIDDSELYQEGQNRVNIYGKDSDGNWTPYER
ncbi:LamG-like jellyroll fold domain-containing protein [Bacillus infantis]|uniref:LamG-like jellyroll fold domain-containing protein n=1 Tax=Bacillus infantis TaxID=324767 RepID=UPI003CFBBC71